MTRKGSLYGTDKSPKQIHEARFVKRIADEANPGAKRIILVMVNFKTHSPSALYEIFEPEEAKRIWDRFEFVFTPKHGSWLNVAEIELHVLNGRCLSRRIPDMETAIREVEAWQNNWNNKNNRINWQFSTSDSRIKAARSNVYIEEISLDLPLRPLLEKLISPPLFKPLS